MDWTCERSEAPQFIRVIGDGLFSGEGFARMFDDLFALPHWRFGIPLLFDQRKIDYSEVTSSQLLTASDVFISRNDQLAFTRIAVIFETADLGLAGRFDLITKQMSKAMVKICRGEKEALDWVTPQNPNMPFWNP